MTLRFALSALAASTLIASAQAAITLTFTSESTSEPGLIRVLVRAVSDDPAVEIQGLNGSFNAAVLNQEAFPPLGLGRADTVFADNNPASDDGLDTQFPYLSEDTGASAEVLYGPTPSSETNSSLTGDFAFIGVTSPNVLLAQLVVENSAVLPFDVTFTGEILTFNTSTSAAGSQSFTNNPVPEPATLSLLALAGLALARRRA